MADTSLYFSYYNTAFILGLFTHTKYAPLCVVLLWHFWVYNLIALDSTTFEYVYLMSFIGLAGVLMGYNVAALRELRALIFFKDAAPHWAFVAFSMGEFALFMGLNLIWSMTSSFHPPINYLVVFFMAIMMVLLFYFITRNWDGWSTKDNSAPRQFWDGSAGLFYAMFGLFYLSSILIFMIWQWSAPNFWPFWIALSVFFWHLLLYFMLDSCILTDMAQRPWKQVMRELGDHMNRNHPVSNAARNLFDFGILHKGSNRRGEQEMEPMERAADHMEVGGSSLLSATDEGAKSKRTVINPQSLARDD